MKIFLAGTFGKKKHAEILKESPYLLESFYYVKDWQVDIIKTRKDFLLDSGAFTFLSNSKTHTDWNEYLERYSAFIKENDIKHFFELDIDKIVGYEEVKRMRHRLENTVNRRVIPVWHRSRGKDEYLRLCDEYDYVAVGGIAIKDIKPNEYNIFTYLIDEAHKRKCKVHGLGFTSTSLLPKYHFDSVDSTRWNCARFGRLEYFDGEKMKPIDRRKEGKRLIGRENENIMAFNLREWIKYQYYAESNL